MAGEAGFFRAEAGPGVTVHTLPTDRFKWVTLALYLHQPLAAETVSALGLLPAVLRRGTESHPTALDLQRALAEMYGAALGADVLKVGDRQVLALSLGLPADRYARDPGLLERAMRFLAEVAARPTRENGLLVREVVEQERALQVQRIQRLRDNKPAYARQRAIAHLFAGEPYGLYELGTPEGVQAVTAQGLADLHRRVLGTSPVDLFVVGDVDPAAVASLAREALNWPDRAPVTPPRAPVARRPAPERTVVEPEEMGQGWVFLGLQTNVAHADPHWYPLLLYYGVLGGTAASKLFTNVRERHSLAYSANARLEASKGVILAFAGIDPGRFEQAVAIMREQIADMASGSFSAEELETARRSLQNSLRAVVDQPGALIERTLRGLVDGRPDAPEEAIARLDQVTRDDIVRTAEKVWVDLVYFLKGILVPAAGR